MSLIFLREYVIIVIKTLDFLYWYGIMYVMKVYITNLKKEFFEPLISKLAGGFFYKIGISSFTNTIVCY